MPTTPMMWMEPITENPHIRKLWPVWEAARAPLLQSSEARWVQDIQPDAYACQNEPRIRHETPRTRPARQRLRYLGHQQNLANATDNPGQTSAKTRPLCWISDPP